MHLAELLLDERLHPRGGSEVDLGQRGAPAHILDASRKRLDVTAGNETVTGPRHRSTQPMLDVAAGNDTVTGPRGIGPTFDRHVRAVELEAAHGCKPAIVARRLQFALSPPRPTRPAPATGCAR